MYIKLGSTNLRYLNQVTKDDYFILSEIVDSSLSFERPTIVRSVKQLDIWFGKDFKDYEYFKELLNMGITLYLYKPVSNDTSLDIEGYIDLNNCEKITHLGSLEEINPKKDKTIYILQTGEEYIYLDDSGFVLVEDLPQNQLPNNTLSLVNRDTLSLGVDYFISPEYSENISLGGELIASSNNYGINSKDLVSNDYKKLVNGYKSFAFDITFGNNFCNLSNDDVQYFGLGDTLYVFSTTNTSRTLTPSEEKIFKNIKYVIVNKNDDKVKIFKETLINDGYFFEDNCLISTKLINVLYYYTLNDFEIEPNYKKSSSLLYNDLKEEEVISFYSKTIGSADKTIDGNIKIEIKKLSQSDYQIVVSRFGYSEIYEGPVTGNVYKEGLSSSISKHSKLVYCNTNVGRGYYKCVKENNTLRWISINEDSLSLGDKSSAYTIYHIDYVYTGVLEGDIAYYEIPLPEGSWELRGAKEENYDSSMYEKSLNILLNQPNPLYIDYLLIPDISKFGTELDNTTGSYKIYKKIYNLSKEIDCQVLIHNKPIEITEEENGSYLITGESAFNYLNDDENRLIYFYDSISVYGEERPGYYIYIKNLLLYDIYSPEVSNIQYNPPVKDPYVGHLTENKRDKIIETWLKEKKVNYLVTNNQIYYYKEYNNGPRYRMTGWMRFCVSKINRELIRNKWDIVETKNVGRIELTINEILSKVKNTFSMIREIKLSDFSISFKDSTIDLTIDTSLSDLMNNQLTIDITLNYNKF